MPIQYVYGVIEFFKKHNLYDEKAFTYLLSNTTMVNYSNPKERGFVGCFYTLNKGILNNIHLVIPYVFDEKTKLIVIHELVHGIELYRRLNKKYDDQNNDEILPMLYEKIYVEEQNNEELRNYQHSLDLQIKEKDTKYNEALKVRDILYTKYNQNIGKMRRLSKKITKKIYH